MHNSQRWKPFRLEMTPIVLVLASASLLTVGCSTVEDAPTPAPVSKHPQPISGSVTCGCDENAETCAPAEANAPCVARCEQRRCGCNGPAAPEPCGVPAGRVD